MSALISASGELLVGESVRDLRALYPERTVRSIKRRTGSSETVLLGGKSLTPPEISAVILRELIECARLSLGERPEKPSLRSRLLLRCAARCHARNGRAREPGSGPHPERTHCLHEEDREEAIDIHERIGAAIESGDTTALAEASRALTELLFFIEDHIGGRPN